MASNDFASEMMKLQELANLIGISGRQQDLWPRFLKSSMMGIRKEGEESYLDQSRSSFVFWNQPS